MEATQPSASSPPRLHGWRHPAVLAAATVSIASGYAQFGVSPALGDVAAEFGTPETRQLGLSATTLGAGLALIRLASVGGLPLAALADRVGRKPVLLAAAGGGLAATAAAATSQSYWVFIALFVVARPLLSATNGVAAVLVAEETSARTRASAVALVSAAYGIGAGLVAVIRGVTDIGFRTLFALSLVPLALLPLLSRWLEEPERFEKTAHALQRQRFRLGWVRPDLRGRLMLLATLTLAASFASSPISQYVFIYVERILGMSRAGTGLVVPAAAVIGVGGLLTGRWSADVLGRRVTAATMQAAAAVAGAVTYSGTIPVALGGYLLGLFVGSAFAPAIGALSAELFPTSERATATGWLTVAGATGAVAGLYTFGRLVDIFGRFEPAALLIAGPMIATAPLYFRLPETRGLELEESAPEEVPA